MANISVSSYQQVFDKADIDRDGIMTLQELDTFTIKHVNEHSKPRFFGPGKKVRALEELITAASLMKKEFEMFQRYNPANLNVNTGITLESIRSVAALDYDPALGDNDIREHNLKQRGAAEKTENTTETSTSRATKEVWEPEDPNNPANATPIRRFATTSSRDTTRNAFVNNTNPYGPINLDRNMGDVLNNSNLLVQENARFLEGYNKKPAPITQKA